MASSDLSTANLSPERVAEHVVHLLDAQLGSRASQRSRSATCNAQQNAVESQADEKKKLCGDRSLFDSITVYVYFIYSIMHQLVDFFFFFFLFFCPFVQVLSFPSP
jgi:hypothetical protein